MKLLKLLLPLLVVVIFTWPQVSPVLADTSYVVQPGDSLLMISLKFGVNMSAIITANGITNPNFVYVGQRLVIPGVSGPSAPAPTASAPAGGSAYIVQSGDSLSKIARKFNVGLSALAAANGITNLNYLYVGQRLVIPGVTVAPAPATAAPGPAPSGSTYTVQGGDTIYRIAQRLGVDPLALIAANGILNPNLIYVGQNLIIPGSTSAPTATAVPTNVPAASTATPVATAVPTATPVPTLPTAGFSSHGITGDAFWIENPTVYAGQAVWFDFTVTNRTNNPVGYSVLAAHTDNGPNAQSWTNQTLKANTQLVWRDHINFSSVGTYQVYLGICYGDKNACLANSVGWDRLSNSVTVVIQ